MWAALAIAAATLVAPDARSVDETVCRAPPASPGQALHGPILHIPAADVLCVATGSDPSKWVPVRLAAPAESRGRLMSAAFGQNATCTINKDGRGDCRVDGDALSGRLHLTSAAGAPEWR